MYRFIIGSLLVLLLAFGLVVSPAYAHHKPGHGTTTAVTTLGVAMSQAQPGSKVTVTWSNIKTPTPLDWFALYSVGAADGSYIDWRYVNCSQSGTVGRATGSCEYLLSSSLARGDYEFRLFANDGWTRLATSGRFTVGATVTPTTGSTATPTPSATATPTSSACLGVPAYSEIRPENTTANKTKPAIVPWSFNTGGDNLRPYYNRITADCQGTTEQILEWASRKWFPEFDPDLLKAVAVAESTWRNSAKGDYHDGCPTFCGDDYQSYGISQVKRSVWPGSYPNTVNSTAFSADYWGAVVRMHFEGQSWVGDANKGDIWDSVGAWFCGCANSANSDYTNKVKGFLQSKPWRQSGF